MKLLHDGTDMTGQQVSSAMGKPLATLDEATDVSEAYRVLLSGTAGIVVTDNSVPVGVITRTDLINYWASQREAS
jgi:cystathionine beta-synthase